MPASFETLVPLATLALVAGCRDLHPPEAPSTMTPVPEAKQAPVKVGDTPTPPTPLAPGLQPLAAPLVPRAPPPPGVDRPVYEPCNRFSPSVASLNVYAIHEYPGRTVVELSAVRAIGHVRPPAMGIPDTPPGFVAVTPLRVYVREGAVAVYCGSYQPDPRDPPAFRGRLSPGRGQVEISGVTFLPPPAWNF